MNRAFYKVGEETDSGAFVGVLVFALGPEQALKLGRDSVDCDDPYALHAGDLDEPDCPSMGPSRVLGFDRPGEASIYRNLGWGEDVDADGNGGRTCSECRLYQFEALPYSHVCTECDLCFMCATMVALRDDVHCNCNDTPKRSTP